MNDLAKLEFYCAEVKSQIELWIERVDGHSVELRYKPDDIARLFKLRVWSVKYSVSIQECLDLIVPVFRAMIKSRHKSTGLGVAIKTLTSRGAERLLGEKLLERYPGNENVRVARELERDHQLGVEALEETEGLTAREPEVKSRLEMSAGEYVKLYEKRILRYRGQVETAASEAWRRRKTYRGNPWG
jgi:hypothetical protein